MHLFLTALNWLLYAVGLYLLLNCLYLLFFSLVGHLRVSIRKSGTLTPQKLRRMCVLIPAYRENAVILETTKAALQHAYEGEKAVVVIADGLERQTVTHLQQLG